MTCILAGIVTPNPFDQMQAASMLSGPNSSIKSTPPASHLYLTGGMGPYVGAFYAVEVSMDCICDNKACRSGGQYWEYYPGALNFKSSHCNLFEDRAPVDEIYGCPIFR